MRATWTAEFGKAVTLPLRRPRSALTPSTSLFRITAIAFSTVAEFRWHCQTPQQGAMQWAIGRIDSSRISKPAASEREALESIETTAAMLGFDIGGRSMALLGGPAVERGTVAGPAPRPVGGGLHAGHARRPLSSDQPQTPPVSGKLGRREIRMRWFAFVVHLVLDRQRMACPTGQG